MADKDNQYRVLAAVQKGTGRKNLKHGQGTLDRSGLPRRSEMVRQTNAEKEVVKEESAHDAVIEEITSGEHVQKLKKTETVDKTQRSKEQLGELLKKEAESYKEAEQKDRAAVLEDVTKGDKKLKKVETKEKNLTNLSKEELIALIKAEREAYKSEDTRAAFLGDIAEGGKKLKKTTTQDKSKKKERGLAKRNSRRKRSNRN